MSGLSIDGCYSSHNGEIWNPLIIHDIECSEAPFLLNPSLFLCGSCFLLWSPQNCCTAGHCGVTGTAQKWFPCSYTTWKQHLEIRLSEWSFFLKQRHIFFFFSLSRATEKLYSKEYTTQMICRGVTLNCFSTRVPLMDYSKFSISAMGKFILQKHCHCLE